MGKLARAVLAISEAETTFERRGFRCDRAEVRDRLEAVGRSFVYGYHSALEAGHSTLAAGHSAPEAGGQAGRAAPAGAPGLAEPLDASPLPMRGFVYEGAAMALALLDTLVPFRRRRLAAFISGPAHPHTYLAHVGVGWALARLPFGHGRLLAPL